MHEIVAAAIEAMKSLNLAEITLKEWVDVETAKVFVPRRYGAFTDETKEVKTEHSKSSVIKITGYDEVEDSFFVHTFTLIDGHPTDLDQKKYDRTVLTTLLTTKWNEMPDKSRVYIRSLVQPSASSKAEPVKEKPSREEKTEDEDEGGKDEEVDETTIEEELVTKEEFERAVDEKVNVKVEAVLAQKLPEAFEAMKNEVLAIVNSRLVDYYSPEQIEAIQRGVCSTCGKVLGSLQRLKTHTLKDHPELGVKK